jgi:hypothetical protein
MAVPHLGRVYQVWSNPDMAVTALPILLDQSAGPLIEYEKDPTLAMLRTAVKSLTTKRERRAYLRDAEEADAEDEKEGAKNRRAAFKVSRVLADPRTPADVRREVQDSLIELCNAAGVIVDHPALATRAFLIAVEQRPKGHVRDVKRARTNLLALLDSISEEKGGEE